MQLGAEKARFWGVELVAPNYGRLSCSYPTEQSPRKLGTSGLLRSKAEGIRG